MGLGLTTEGGQVAIADLDDDKLAFAAWRFSRRGLPVTVVPVRSTECTPALTVGAFDVVIATEVLEHVRDPLALLTTLTDSLRLSVADGG